MPRLQETPPQESVPAGTPKVELSEATGAPEPAQSPSTAARSPQAQSVQPMDASPGDGGVDASEQPRKRASRASKNAAMASWKANRMLEEDDDEEGSLGEDRPGRRSKKVRCVCGMGGDVAGGVVCERVACTEAGARVTACAAWLQVKREDSVTVPASAKAGPGLAKVYSNAAATMSNVLGEDHGVSGNDPVAGLTGFGSGQQWSSGGNHSGPVGVGDLGLAAGSQQNLSLPLPRSSTLPGSQGDVGGGAGGWGGGGPTGSAGGGSGVMPQAGLGGDVPVRPRSTPLNPFTNYTAFQHEQDMWRRRVGEINNQWVQKLQEGAKTNAEVQALLRYYMSLPDVSQVYPVNADARMGGPMASTGSGGAPSPGLGGNNGHGSVNLPTGSGIQVRGAAPTARSAACGAADVWPMECVEERPLSGWGVQGSGQLNGASPMSMQQGANSQQRALPGQGMGSWNAAPARKESLHNGPISAQDLATGIRGRPASSDDSRQCALATLPPGTVCARAFCTECRGGLGVRGAAG